MEQIIIYKQTMKKILKISAISFIALMVVIGIASIMPPRETAEAAGAAGPRFDIASSTVFTLTTTSQRLLATSTPTQRMAFSIQPINCTSGSSGGVNLNFRRDVVATSATGPFAFASTTNLFGDHVNGMPVVQHAVQGIVTTGTCTVIVTEWRLQQ